MVFDIENLPDTKKEKIAIGALKYIAIKEAFKRNEPLYENKLFRKYFTDFYKLTKGAFSTPIMQEAFYRLFQSIRELYDKKYYRCELFKNISTIISTIAGDNEKSFPSKILHTLDNDSPIIDNNVLKELNLKKSNDPYKDLCKEYFVNSIKFKSAYSSGNVGLLGIAKKEGLDEKFESLCIEYLNGEIKNISKKREKTIDIIKDIYSIKDKIFDMAKETTIGLKNEIGNISLVKKIDFYLWAKFSEKGAIDND